MVDKIIDLATSVVELMTAIIALIAVCKANGKGPNKPLPLRGCSHSIPNERRKAKMEKLSLIIDVATLLVWMAVLWNMIKLVKRLDKNE